MKKVLFRRAFAIAAVLILSACTTRPPVNAQVQPGQGINIRQTGDNSASKTIESTAFKNQQVMAPIENIEKNKLQVSYSMKVIPAEAGYLVQISMIFRNMKDQSANIKPKITLSDSRGSHIQAYTKQGFLKLASKGNTASKSKNPANKTADDSQSSGDEKIKWAHSYWLKSNFTIPPLGIEIGELIYHSNSLNFPMKLTVNSAGQDFIFTLNDNPSLSVEQRNPAK
ncbi:MAG: hypothetical protein NTY60_00670 [Proteobacteria bacterium]|nr:hypothetical protein [Pseudomonadota bacterium]